MKAALAKNGSNPARPRIRAGCGIELESVDVIFLSKDRNSSILRQLGSLCDPVLYSANAFVPVACNSA